MGISCASESISLRNKSFLLSLSMSRLPYSLIHSLIQQTPCNFYEVTKNEHTEEERERKKNMAQQKPALPNAFRNAVTDVQEREGARD